MDLNMLCRLCAKEDRLCIQVFGEEGIKQHVAKKIRLCMPIIVKETDDYPKQICLNCLSNLDTSYELYNRCLEAQSVIKNLMMVNVQNNGEMLKVYSTQEMLKMVNELREKMCEKRPALRLGNTVYTIQDTASQTEDSSNDGQKAKKRKQEVMKTSNRGMVYPVLGGAGPIAQPYMLMPPAMPPAVMIPSAVPHGQFAIGTLPAIQTYPMAMQAMSQTSVSKAPAVETNSADIQGLAPELVSKVTKTSTAQIGTVSSTAAARQQSDVEIVPVQPVQHAPHTQTIQSSTSSAPTVQQASQPKTSSVNSLSSLSESAVPTQIPSIQSAIQAFHNSTPLRIASIQSSIPLQANPVPQLPAPKFALNNRAGQTLQSSSSSSVTETEIASVQVFPPTPLPEIVSAQVSKTSMATGPFSQTNQQQSEEQSPTEILPTTNDSLLPEESLISTPKIPKQSSSPERIKPPQSRNMTLMLKMDADDDDDDDDDYAADDPDPLDNDGEEEQEKEAEEEEEEEKKKQKKKTENKTVADKELTAETPESQDETRDVTPTATVEELSSDGSVAGNQNNTHVCPYCNKSFPEDVIFHHKKLHFRQKFFSCIMCNKNFRTEAGLENHRCD